MGTEEDIKEALTPTVRAAGLDIWDVERSGASIRVLVERPGGVDLDAISELSGAVSAVLDHRDDLVPTGHYVLEVSSPGLERRLRCPAHFSRCIGEEVAVKTAEPFFGSRRLTGTLVAVDEDRVTMKVVPPAQAEPGQDLLQIPFPAIERAHLVFKWPVATGPAPRGQRRRREPAASSATGGATWQG
jgi:ribosome maturation factor RimP